jgi:hypothetical protein
MTEADLAVRRLNFLLNGLKSARTASTHARRTRRTARYMVTLAVRADGLKAPKLKSIHLATLALARCWK